MSLEEHARISYRVAERMREDVLRRWLVWASRNDPAGARILRESAATKVEVLRALVWIGAIG